MNTQLFLDLAASEEASGYPANARALRAVPDVVAALRNVCGACGGEIEWWDTEGLARHEGTGKTTKQIQWEVINEARAALAALDATTANNNDGD